MIVPRLRSAELTRSCSRKRPVDKAPNPYLERDHRPLRERGTMWTPDKTAEDVERRPDLQLRILRNYYGVLALLGRVAERVPRDDLAERTSIEQAFIDANEVLRRTDSDTHYERSSRGGFSLFDGSPLPVRKTEDAGLAL